MTDPGFNRADFNRICELQFWFFALLEDCIKVLPETENSCGTPIQEQAEMDKDEAWKYSSEAVAHLENWLLEQEANAETEHS